MISLILYHVFSFYRYKKSTILLSFGEKRKSMKCIDEKPAVNKMFILSCLRRLFLPRFFFLQRIRFRISLSHKNKHFASRPLVYLLLRKGTMSSVKKGKKEKALRLICRSFELLRHSRSAIEDMISAYT